MRNTLRKPFAWMGVAALALAGLIVFYQVVGAEGTATPLTGTAPCCCGKPAPEAPSETSRCCAAQGQDCPTKNTAVAAVQDKKKDKDMPMPSAEAMAKGKAARKSIQDHQKVLQADGTYSCCIKPGCTFCSTSADMCPCAKMLAKGGPVCPECWGGWQAGAGRLEGVQKDKVKIIPQDKLKMMYMMRAKNFQKAAE